MLFREVYGYKVIINYCRFSHAAEKQCFSWNLKQTLSNAPLQPDAYYCYDKITNFILDDNYINQKSDYKYLFLLKIQKLKQGNILAKKFVFIIGKYSKL